LGKVRIIRNKEAWSDISCRLSNGVLTTVMIL
jgi:hypothetical protein